MQLLNIGVPLGHWLLPKVKCGMSASQPNKVFKTPILHYLLFDNILDVHKYSLNYEFDPFAKSTSLNLVRTVKNVFTKVLAQ